MLFFVVLLSRLLVHVSSSLHQNRKYIMVAVYHGNRQSVLAIAVTAGGSRPLVVDGKTNRPIRVSGVRRCRGGC